MMKLPVMSCEQEEEEEEEEEKEEEEFILQTSIQNFK